MYPVAGASVRVFFLTMRVKSLIFISIVTANSTSRCPDYVATKASLFTKALSTCRPASLRLAVALSPTLDERDFSATTHPPAGVPTTVSFQIAYGDNRNRTDGLLLAKQVLSQRELYPHVTPKRQMPFGAFCFQSPHEESNPGQRFTRPQLSLLSYRGISYYEPVILCDFNCAFGVVVNEHPGLQLHCGIKTQYNDLTELTQYFHVCFHYVISSDQFMRASCFNNLIAASRLSPNPSGSTAISLSVI